MNPKLNAKTLSLSKTDIERIRRENPNARIMEVVEKKRPNLGQYTLEGLKTCEGGLGRWIERVAQCAKTEWIAMENKLGSITQSDSYRSEIRVCVSVRKILSCPPTGIPTTTDHARALAFPHLFRSACGYDAFKKPNTLQVLQFLVASHRKWDKSKGSKAKIISDREMVKALSSASRMAKK